MPSNRVRTGTYRQTDRVRAREREREIQLHFDLCSSFGREILCSLITLLSLHIKSVKKKKKISTNECNECAALRCESMRQWTAWRRTSPTLPSPSLFPVLYHDICKNLQCCRVTETFYSKNAKRVTSWMQDNRLSSL